MSISLLEEIVLLVTMSHSGLKVVEVLLSVTMPLNPDITQSNTLSQI